MRFGFYPGVVPCARATPVTLSDHLPFRPTFEQALLVACAISLLSTLLVMPRIIRKLHGARVVGRDINKPGRPEVAEMGGLGVFLGLFSGVFAFLLVGELPMGDESVILVALITCAGAAMTGIIDDLVELRQRFKAFIPVVFAAPLAVYLSDYSIALPMLGPVDFGIFYPLVLVPLGITCAANGFNILEGYNGMGAGIGLVSTGALILLVILGGNWAALVLLVPLAATLLAFLWFNKYPARVFPGDTMTLLVGAVLAAAAMIGKVEFWGALLFVPHIVEFFLKSRGGFTAQNFAKRITPRPAAPPLLAYDGRTESLTHIALKRRAMTEPGVSALFWSLQVAVAAVSIGTFLATR